MDGRVIALEELARATTFGDMVPVYKIDATTVVKTGDCVRLAEAETMRFVRSNTSIPVPEVYNAYVDSTSGNVRIVMEFIEGDCLKDVWDNFDSEQKQDVVEQLRGFISQLRQIKGSFIGAVDGTACEDQLFTDGTGAYGPYKDERSFNEGICVALRNKLSGGWANTVLDMVFALKYHEIVLTHGDLSPRNIIVRGSKVVAVLDWEMAGYYPEYWEYVKALYMPTWEGNWIKERTVDKIMGPYRMELAVFLQVRTILW